MEVLVVPTGVANTASVTAALNRLGALPRPSTDAAELAAAPAVVLPGVGAFGAAVERLDELGLRGALRERLAAGRPTLSICLGLQLLCASSEESPGARGLGVVDAKVTRLPAGLRVPQLGWNLVTPVRSELLEAGYAYFANTYCLGTLPPAWGGAVTDYGGPFASALERGAVLACQFHPEISGVYGACLLQRWLARAAEVA